MVATVEHSECKRHSGKTLRFLSSRFPFFFLKWSQQVLDLMLVVIKVQRTGVLVIFFYSYVHCSTLAKMPPSFSLFYQYTEKLRLRTRERTRGFDNCNFIDKYRCSIFCFIDKPGKLVFFPFARKGANVEQRAAAHARARERKTRWEKAVLHLIYLEEP